MLSLKNKILMTAATVALSATSGAHVAHAQQGNVAPQQAQQGQAQAQQVNVTDQEMRDFVDAEQAVRQVKSKFQGKVQNIKTQEQLQALQAKANEQMVQAIRENGLKVEEYNRTAQAIQTNPQVQKKYLKLVQ